MTEAGRSLRRSVLTSTLLLVVAVLVSACEGTENLSTPVAADTAPVVTEAHVVPATVPPTTPQTTAPPNLVLGGMGVVGVDGVGVQVAVITVVPEGFAMGDEMPVLLAFPPGDQALDTASAVVDGIYEEQALARGWIVVSPVAPNGVSFWQGSEVHIEPILDWIETWVQSEGGAVHLAGVSNGGISVFRAASLHPERVASMVVFPGYPRGGDPLEAVAHLPIRMFVGGADLPWIEPMEQTRDALLALGADVTLEVVAGAPHFIPELADGVVLFDVLDRLRTNTP